MASIRVLPSNKLYIDFRYLDERFREATLLENTAPNKKKLGQMAKRSDVDMPVGTFDYAKYSSESKSLKKVALLELRNDQGRLGNDIPTINQQIDRWLEEKEIEWRVNYRNTMVSIIDKHIRPELGDLPLDALLRDRAITFRSGLAKYRTPGGKPLSNATINRIMTMLKAVVEDGCIRHKLVTPFERIKKLKEVKVHIEPFNLNEVTAMIADVRSDFRDYLITRFFTGMRSAEINGLRWKYIDFDRREILVRETFTQGNFEYTKNDPSQREIAMSAPVFDALKRQFEITGHGDRNGLVFCSRQGTPIDSKNFTNRIWKPMLVDLDIAYRRPYNTRHTCATLWLASGEAPEWTARQLGHANTQMLFSVYSRYVPNLTRNDGSAFERMLASTGTSGVVA